MKFYFTILITLLFILTACENSEKTTLIEVSKEIGHSSEHQSLHSSPIEIIVLREDTFYHEIISNGTLIAPHSAEIRFESSELIKHIWVQNGDRVKKGQTLSQLDNSKLEYSLQQAKINLKQSELNLQDILISRGFSPTDASIPPEELELAQLKSGYKSALLSFQAAEKSLASATLTAPFDGIIANVTAKENNHSTNNDLFCLLIDDRELEVSFPIIESEYCFLNKDCIVSIKPLSQKGSSTYSGRITEINPVISNNGLIQVKAKIKNNGSLLVGMNTSVLVKCPIKKALIIPKTAVVLRSNKPVVFTKVNGVAQWNYVQILAENSKFYVIEARSKEYEGLSPGDSIVISGNLHLMHGNKIE